MTNRNTWMGAFFSLLRLCRCIFGFLVLPHVYTIARAFLGEHLGPRGDFLV